MDFNLTLLFQVLLLVGVSAICSGLNIAFMSLDLSDLKRKAKLGNVYARRVLPLRQKSHLTLAAILLTNVGAVSATSLVLEHEFNGLVAGIAATLLIVIFGEIFPQALFARQALTFCGRLSPLLRLMILLTYPVAKPLQLLLDKLFGDERVSLQSRSELGIMISEHLGPTAKSELDEDEVEIIRGALQLSEKQVKDIMVPINMVYWLTPESIIDAVKIDELKLTGYSRIPIFDNNLTRCEGVLLLRELIDFDDNNPVLVRDLPLFPAQTVGSRTALDTMFRKFISAQTHLVPIEKDGEIVGIATIEDLIEEILGHEIVDETDRRR